jgi:hypothetical protein
MSHFAPRPFEDELEESRRGERLLVWKQLGALVVVALVVVARHLWLG